MSFGRRGSCLIGSGRGLRVDLDTDRGSNKHLKLAPPENGTEILRCVALGAQIQTHKMVEKEQRTIRWAGRAPGEMQPRSPKAESNSNNASWLMTFPAFARREHDGSASCRHQKVCSGRNKTARIASGYQTRSSAGATGSVCCNWCQHVYTERGKYIELQGGGGARVKYTVT